MNIIKVLRRKRATEPDAPIWSRDRMALTASGIAGTILGISTYCWSIRAIGHSYPAGIALDFAIGGYLCFLLILIQRRLTIGIALSVAAIVGAYFASLLKFEVMQAEASFSDLSLLDDLFIHYAAEGDWRLYAILALLLGLVGLFLSNLRLPTRQEAVLFAPCFGYIAVIGFALFAPQAMAAGALGARSVNSWFPIAVVRGHWGAFFESGVEYVQRHERYQELKASVAPDMGFVDSSLPPVSPRNIHIVVLESFIDPLSIAGAEITSDPFAPLFQQWRRESQLRSVQPVFAGRSPDGEFEILCGLPAVLGDSPIIFSRLVPSSVDCLPNKLHALGWRTESWVPVSPLEFTYDQAYQRIGLEFRRFNRDVDMSDRDGESLSANSLLQQNLAHVRQVIGSPTPLLNYVFVTAGHYPYLLNKDKRPYRVDVHPSAGVLARYVNGIYYTSHAVQAYVEELRRIDPDSIIVVTGDHPPGLPALPAQIQYPRPISSRFDVPLIIYDGTRGPIGLTGRIPGYFIPGVIADLLTNGAYCERNRCLHQEATAARPLRNGLLMIERATDKVVDCGADAAGAACQTAQQVADRMRLALFNLSGVN